MTATLRSYLRAVAPTIALLASCAAQPAASLRADELQVSPNLANQLRYVQVTMNAGRVAAAGTFSGRSLDSSSQTQERREKLRVDMNGESPSISYELTSPTMQVSLTVENGDTLRIRRTPVGDGKSTAIDIDQPSEGKITVAVGQGPQAKKYVVDSWWHLYAADPDFVRKEIEPLLRLLRPGWPVAASGQEVVDSLFRRVDAERNYDRQAWSKLVDQLRGQHYVDRIEADRSLRELGQIVIPYLRGLDEKRLDAEQLFRIRKIVQSYNGTVDDDSPDAAAQWLSADPEIWYALATRASAAQRTKVRAQLAVILGEPVVLDAEATGETLAKQLAAIRGQLDRIKSSSAPQPR